MESKHSSESVWISSELWRSSDSWVHFSLCVQSFEFCKLAHNIAFISVEFAFCNGQLQTLYRDLQDRTPTEVCRTGQRFAGQRFAGNRNKLLYPV